jgi:hypothetical protein
MRQTGRKVTAQAKQAKYKPFYVYGDEEETPYILVNPPSNLGRLLQRWNKLDRLMTEGDEKVSAEWEPVNVWLQKQGVQLIEAHAVYLDDYL